MDLGCPYGQYRETDASKIWGFELKLRLMVPVYEDNGGILDVQQPKRGSFHPILAGVALWVEVGFKASPWGW